MRFATDIFLLALANGIDIIINKKTMDDNGVWIFNGLNGRFPSGVFTSKGLADSWIKENRLSGVLTLYPINTGVYEWAINQNYFVAKKESESSPDFIQCFTSGSQEHYHYENGELE